MDTISGPVPAEDHVKLLAEGLLVVVETKRSGSLPPAEDGSTLMTSGAHALIWK